MLELCKDFDILLVICFELFEWFNYEFNVLFNEVIILQLNQKQLFFISESLCIIFDEQMFWIFSNQLFDLFWFKMILILLKNQFIEIFWGFGVCELGEGLVDWLLLFLLLFLLIVVLLWKCCYLYDKLVELNDDIGYFKCDSQLYILLVILIIIFFVLFGILIFVVVGLVLLLDVCGQNVIFGSVLLEMVQVWLLFYIVYCIFILGGIVEWYFYWSCEQVGFFDWYLVCFGVVVLVLVGVVMVVEYQLVSLVDDVIGIVVVLFGYVVMVWLFSCLLFSSFGDECLLLIKMIVGIFFIVLLMVFFVVVCFGYYYILLKFIDCFIDIFYLLLFWFVIEVVFVCGLGVVVWCLVYVWVLVKWQNVVKEGVDGEINVEELIFGIEQINQ